MGHINGGVSQPWLNLGYYVVRYIAYEASLMSGG